MSGAETGDRLGQGTERCWKRSMCVYWEIWVCGYAIIAAERTAAQSEQAGIDSSCVLKETWCKASFFHRGKEKHVEMFSRLLCKKNTLTHTHSFFFPQYHLARGLLSYQNASWVQHHLSFSQINSKVFAYQTVFSCGCHHCSVKPFRNNMNHVHFSTDKCLLYHKTPFTTPETSILQLNSRERVKILFYL